VSRGCLINGVVSWLIKRPIDEDKLMEIAIEAGADDVQEEEHEYEVLTDPANLNEVRSAIERQGIKILSSRISMVPRTTVQLSGEKAISMLKLMERMEDNDDVQNVYANFDIPDEIMEEME